MTLPKNFVRAGIVGITMFIAYKIWAKGNTIKNLLFEISKVNYTFSGNGLILTAMINVKNIKEESILINSINVDLLFNNEKIGAANNTLNIQIPSQNSIVVPVSVEILYTPVIKLITDLISGKMKQAAVFTLKGNAKIEDILFPLDLKYTLL